MNNVKKLVQDLDEKVIRDRDSEKITNGKLGNENLNKSNLKTHWKALSID
jgi:hypothetical protein